MTSTSSSSTVHIRAGQSESGGQFELVKRIGDGAFGCIFRGFDTVTKEEVALKLEELSARQPQLRHEGDMYKLLGSENKGIPRIRWSGLQDDYYVLVMDLLGASLQHCFDYCKHRFSVKTVLYIADQMLERIEFIHSR